MESSSSSTAGSEVGDVDRPTMEDVMHHQKHFELPGSLQGRCQETYGWSLEFADKVLQGYRQFIKLKQVLADWDDRNVLPSPTVKKVWMLHLQYTRQYGKSCDSYCGNMIHHDPEHEVTQHQQTKTELYLEKQFGQVEKSVWWFESERYGEDDTDISDSQSTSSNDTLYTAKSNCATGGSYIPLTQHVRLFGHLFGGEKIPTSEENASDVSSNSNAVETEMNVETASSRAKSQEEVNVPVHGIPCDISCNDGSRSTCSSELGRTSRGGFAHEEQTMQSAGVNAASALEMPPEQMGQLVHKGKETGEQHFRTDQEMRETVCDYQNGKQALHEELLREREKNEELSSMNEDLKHTLQTICDIESGAGNIQDLQLHGEEKESLGGQLMENRQQVVVSNQKLQWELIACQKDKKCLEDDLLREIDIHRQLCVAHDALRQTNWLRKLDEGALQIQLTREVEEHNKCKNDKDVLQEEVDRCYEYEEHLEILAGEIEQQLHCSQEEKKTLQARLVETSEELRQCQDEKASLGMKLFSKAAQSLKLIDSIAALTLKLQKRTCHRDKLQVQLNSEINKRVQLQIEKTKLQNRLRTLQHVMRDKECQEDDTSEIREIAEENLESEDSDFGIPMNKAAPIFQRPGSTMRKKKSEQATFDRAGEADETTNATLTNRRYEGQGQHGPLQRVVTKDDEEKEPGETRPAPVLPKSNNWQENEATTDLSSTHSEFEDSGQEAVLASRHDEKKSADARLVSVVSTDEDGVSTTNRTSTVVPSEDSGGEDDSSSSSSSKTSSRTKARFTSVSPKCGDGSNLSPQQTRAGTRSSGRGARFGRGGGIVRGHGIRDKVKALIPKGLRELQDHNSSGFCDVAPQTASREWKCRSCMEVNDALATNCRNDFCNKRRPRRRHCKNIEFEVREWDWGAFVDRETILLDTPELFRRGKKDTDLPQLKRLGKDILGEARAKNRHRGPKENSAFKREIEMVGKGYFKGVLSDDATSSLLDQCPSGSGFVVKSGAGEQMVAFVNLSINTCDTHVDDFVGFLLVLAGKKIVYMAQPALAKKLRDKKATHVPNEENFSSNYFPEVKPFEYDVKQAAEEGWQRYELGPGDGIVIPTNWLHSIQSVNGTVGVSLKIGPAHSGLRGGGSFVPLLPCISDDVASDDEIDQETAEIVSLAGDKDEVIALCSEREDDSHEGNRMIDENRAIDFCSDGEDDAHEGNRKIDENRAVDWCSDGEDGGHEGNLTIDDRGVVVFCSDGEEDDVGVALVTIGSQGAEVSEASEDESSESSDGNDDCVSVDSDEKSNTPEDDNSSLFNDETSLSDSEEQQEHDSSSDEEDGSKKVSDCSGEEDTSDSDSQVERGESQESNVIVTQSRGAKLSGKQCRKGKKMIPRRQTSSPRGKEDRGSSTDGKGNSVSGRDSTTTVLPSQASGRLLHRKSGKTKTVTRGQKSQQRQLPSHSAAAEAVEDMSSRRSRRRRTAVACGLCKKVWGDNDLQMWLLLRKTDDDSDNVETQQRPHIVCFDCCDGDHSPRLPKLPDGHQCYYNKNTKKEYEAMIPGYKPDLDV